MRLSLQFYLLSFPLLAQINTPGFRGAADISLAGGILHNPSNFEIKGNQVQAYSQILFGLAELNEYGLIWQKHRKGKNLGAAFIQSGPEHYQKSVLHFAFGMPLGGNLGLGLRLGLQRLQLVEQAISHSVAIGLNWSYRLSQNWLLSGALNHHHKKMTKWDFCVESRIQMEEQVVCFAGFQLKAQEGPQLPLALIFEMINKLHLIQGVTLSRFLSYHAGLSYQFAPFQFAFSRVWQKALGWQESVSLIYQW